MRFWDSSALVPLAIHQDSSRRTDAWYRADHQIAIWTLTPVEVVSAIHRLLRMRTLEPRVAREAEARVVELATTASMIVDVNAVKATAVRLLRLHPLRAADALQLGAALQWAESNPAGRVFHTLDDRLGEAALREGFDVLSRSG